MLSSHVNDLNLQGGVTSKFSSVSYFYLKKVCVYNGVLELTVCTDMNKNFKKAEFIKTNVFSKELY